MRSCRPPFAPNTRWPALGGSGEGRREHRNVNTLFPLARSAKATLLTRSLRTQARPAEPPPRDRRASSFPWPLAPPRGAPFATNEPDHSRGPIPLYPPSAHATLSRADSTPEADSGLLPLFCVHR